MADTTKLTHFAGINLTDSTLGVYLTSGSTDPVSEGQITYVSGTGFRAYGASGVFTIGSGGGGGVGGGLESAYSIGGTENDITVDEGPVTWTDATAGALNTMEFVKSGAGSGNVLDFAINAALTGNVIDIDMNSGIAAGGIYIDCGAGARTGADIKVKDDSTGNHSVIDIDKSGAGASTGFDYQESYNGSSGSKAISITLDAADGIDTTGIYVSRGTGVRTAPVMDVNDGSTGSADIFDIDLTGIYTGDVFDFASGAAATGNVFFINLDNAVAMTALHVEGSGVRTQPMIEIATDCTGASDLIDIAITGVSSGNIIDIDIGAAITGNVIDIDMNLGVASKAIYIDAGNGTRTADLVDLKHDGDGDVSAINIDHTNTGSGNIIEIDVDAVHTGNAIDINYGTGAATGHAINIATGTNLAGNAILVTTTGVRTAPVINVVGGGTDGGTDDHIILITQSAVLDSNLIQLTYDTAASTGNAVGITMGTNLAGSALVIAGTGARTDDLIKIDDDSTGNSHIFDINVSGIYTGNVIDIAFSVAAATGHALNITTGTNLAGNAILITTAGIRTAPVIFIDGDGADGGTDDHLIFIQQSGILDSNAIQITYDTAASTGDAIGVTMGTNLAGSALVISRTGVVTDDTIKIDSDQTGATHQFDINLSGAGSGNCFDLTYSAAANTGDAISLAMGTNVAGRAIAIASSGTGVSGEGCAIDITHDGNLVAGADLVNITSTGDIDATSNLLAIEQSTGAGTAGSNALYINAAGTNVEAIEIAAGVLFEAEVTATPGSGNGETLPVTGNTIFYDPNGASRTGVIITPGLRDGQHIKIVNIADAAETITFAAAGTSNVAGGASVSIAQYELVEFVWNAATSYWYCMGAGL